MQNIEEYRPRYHNPIAIQSGFNLIHGGGDEGSRTIYVGNIDQLITEEFVRALFGQVGRVVQAKIFYDWGSFSVFAFLEFSEHREAVRAIAFNGRILFNRDMKVRLMSIPAPRERIDTAEHFHVFVGDLDCSIDDNSLREAFSSMGAISDAKVIREPGTLRSKGYGFISFPIREDAQRAIEEMNGKTVGRRSVRVNWASRRGFGVKMEE